MGEDVNMRTLKFWPFPSPSPATLIAKVDHFPSSPSKVPLGFRTTGGGGSGIVAASALRDKTIVPSRTLFDCVALRSKNGAQHEQGL
jgi:hypothetical protein